MPDCVPSREGSGVLIENQLLLKNKTADFMNGPGDFQQILLSNNLLKFCNNFRFLKNLDFLLEM